VTRAQYRHLITLRAAALSPAESIALIEEVEAGRA